MELNLTTPALLFPALSLLLLAYTNRFLTLAGLIRNLHKEREAKPKEHIQQQITNLRKRIVLIRDMQFWGITSLFLCVACMFCMFLNWLLVGEFIFGICLITMMISLGISIYEIRISVKALNIELDYNE